MTRCTFALGHLISLVLLCIFAASCAAEPGEELITPTTSATLRPMPTGAPGLPPTHASTPAPTPLPTEPPPGEPDLITHTVQSGDTLSGLAVVYGVPMAAIQLLNGMGESTVVQVEQALAIPAQSDWEEGETFWIVRVVKTGETLLGIARAYDLDLEKLLEVNNLTDADHILVDQELVLPLDGPAPAFVATPAPSPTAPPTVPPTSTTTPSPSVAVDAESPAASPVPTGLAPAPPPAEIAAWPHETARIINEMRAHHGLPPLAYNETLAMAAQAHANDCVQRGWCGHTGSDGSNIKARVLRAGYDGASWAECWAQRKTPQGAVDIWMDEVPPNDPHRRTLLTTWFTEIGLGVAETDWGYYFIADFGRPRGG